MKSAVIIVLFYPNQEVIGNIKSYIDEIDIVYLVDNSNCINDIFKKIKKVKYMPMMKNFGFCEGLNIGCRQAILDGYNILVTMNQDTFCPQGTIKKLIASVNCDSTKIYGTNYKFIYRDKDGQRIFSNEFAHHTITEKVPWIITSGNAFSSDIYEKVGGFDKQLFIDNIDRDFCYRVIEQGYQIIRLGNVFIYQEPGNTKKLSICGKTIHIPNMSPLRYYYIFRNELYLRRKYKSKYKIFHVKLWKYLISIVFFERCKIKKLKACLIGVKDVNKVELKDTNQCINFL